MISNRPFFQSKKCLKPSAEWGAAVNRLNQFEDDLFNITQRAPAISKGQAMHANSVGILGAGANIYIDRVAPLHGEKLSQADHLIEGNQAERFTRQLSRAEQQ